MNPDFSMREPSEQSKPELSPSPAARGSAASETVVRTIGVTVNAPGWYGRFAIPETYFNELTTFLALRACGEKPPNEKLTHGGTRE